MMFIPASSAWWVVAMASDSFVPNYFQPLMAQVPSAIRDVVNGRPSLRVCLIAPV